MEALEAISEGAWNSLGGMYISDEADFMSELIGTCTFPPGVERGAVDEVQPGSWPSFRSSFNIPITSVSASFSSQISSGPYLSSNESGTDVLFSGTLDQENYYLDDPSPVLARNSCSVPMDCCSSQCPSEWIMESSENPKETTFQETHSQLELQNSHEVEFSPMGDEVLSSSIIGKRSRSSEDLHKRMRTGRSEVARKLDFSNNNEEEANAARPRGPSSSPCDSHDDSNGGATCSSLSPKGSALCNNNLTSSPNSKTRASRGSATEPQSLYARKRREKINARLRILQSLVPNGTKVDISTMLEEAVHYVKFLQLQIKMLSSDELWMYAPIAYNGMDVGLNKIARGRQF